MSPWRSDAEPVLAGHGVRHRIREGAAELRHGAALDLLATSDAFRAFLTGLIVACDYRALRWETPPITRRTVQRPFEFVLVDDPFLEMAPEPDVFGPYFADQAPGADVLAVYNLGRTAKLVVPRQIVEPRSYVHLKAFLRDAPAPQVHALWQCVAVTARQRLSDEPLWVSTAGGGVSWLHVRLEREPKYYAYRPYARAA